MGQQQLLLVILVTIIVGIATVVALNVFGSSAENANRDAVRQDMLAIGAAAQGWYIKPTMMGGGGNNFANMDFQKIQFSGQIDAANPLKSTNANGTYILGTDGDKTQISLTAHPSSCLDYDETKTSPCGNSEQMAVTIIKDGMENWIIGTEPEVPVE